MKLGYSDFVDVNIGYQFVNILYREGSGSLGVAMDLINDVREQNGGGGEPLIFEDWCNEAEKLEARSRPAGLKRIEPLPCKREFIYT